MKREVEPVHGAFSLAWPVDYASHDRDLHRALDGSQLLSHIGSQFDQVDLDPAAKQ
jgi:hypothetical protein